MPSLEPYRNELDYSYAPGIFPGMECLLHRPESVRRLLVHSAAAGRDGIEKLIALAETHRIRIENADRALARISGKENCWAAAVFSKFSDTLQNGRSHVVLHCPGDSGNVGTILRTALGLGIEDVALIRPCVDVFIPLRNTAMLSRNGLCIPLCWTRPFQWGRFRRFRLFIP